MSPWEIADKLAGWIVVLLAVTAIVLIVGFIVGMVKYIIYEGHRDDKNDTK